MIHIEGYIVHQLLGQGGMASVYLATQQSLQRKVALKVLTQTQAPEDVQRFIHEAHTIAALHHPAIITIFDINQLADGRYYLAMEYIAGGDLSQYKGQVFNPTQALHYLKQIAQGLAVVHQHGLVHRDLKPANLLFRDNTHLVITDFGIAKNLSLNTELTQHGIVVGSPAYSSPEQAQCLALDQRSDIYSLGVIFVEMLLGYNPFKGESYSQTVINHVQMPVPTLNSELSAYQNLVNQLLAKQPEDRFADCHALIQAIDDVLDAKPMPRTQPHAAIVTRIKALKWPLMMSSLIFIVWMSSPIIYKQWQVWHYLNLAQQRFNAKQWLFPAQDSAQFFYQQALHLDSDNDHALKGLQQTRAAQMAFWLQQAEQQFALGQLAEPERNNAIFYFQQVLSLDSKQAAALAGLQRIAQVYVALSEEAYEAKKFDEALASIQTGLLAAPTHAGLLALQANHKQRVAALTTVKPTNKSKSSKNPKTKDNGLKKFWRKLWG
ncbi:serine/threonine protein kinase [Agitococcus lubricus]|uniref:serine/threonine protein kinase n=1 Tax=Agitococcus lubricus TaxID=1077255 RepID=UPI00147579B2|nr:serine/threonine-protein kinase [Agitococcus lubricus]